MFHIRSIKQPETKANAKIHYCFNVDISGSMSYDLPRLREDLKNKLATDLQPGQYVTIIYYSSNGECGYVLDGFFLENALSITTASQAIDNWLKPQSLTGFVDPLRLTYNSIKKFKDLQMDTIVVFMSDGYENQNKEDDVLDACKRIGVHALACYVIEYGDYANHRLLEKMAETLFGQLIFAGQLPDYNLVIDSVLGTRNMLRYTVDPTPEDLIVYVKMENGFIRSWKIKDQASFDINIDPASEVKIVSSHPHDDDMTNEEMLCAITAFFQLGMVDNCHDSIAALGDVDIMDRFTAAIGKQRRNQFVEFLRARIIDTDLLFEKPRNYTYSPNPLEPDFFDLIDVLSAEEGNKLLCRHHLFRYRRGTAKVESKNEDVLNFEEYANQSIDFTSIVLNTSRANVSFRGKLQGTVDVKNHPNNPDPKHFGIIPTHIYRTYNIVRDGVFVMDKIPVYLNESTLKALSMLDFIPEQVEPGVWLIDLQSIPIANMNRVKDAADGYVLCDTVFGYKILQAWQKVFRYYESQLEIKKPSTEWIDKYGETGSGWLHSIGIHETNGFHPVNTMSIKNDFYYAPVVEVKVKGFNSLPSMPYILKRIEAEEELTGANLAMAKAIKAYQMLLLKKNAKVHLKTATEGLVVLKREYEKQLAGLIFTNLLSRQPFTGFVNDELTANCTFNETFTVQGDKFLISHPTETLTFKIQEEEEEVSI